MAGNCCHRSEPRLSGGRQSFVKDLSEVRPCLESTLCSNAAVPLLRGSLVFLAGAIVPLPALRREHHRLCKTRETLGRGDRRHTEFSTHLVANEAEIGTWGKSDQNHPGQNVRCNGLQGPHLSQRVFFRNSMRSARSWRVLCRRDGDFDDWLARLGRAVGRLPGRDDAAPRGIWGDFQRLGCGGRPHRIIFRARGRREGLRPILPGHRRHPGSPRQPPLQRLPNAPRPKNIPIRSVQARLAVR